MKNVKYFSSQEPKRIFNLVLVLQRNVVFMFRIAGTHGREQGINMQRETKQCAAGVSIHVIILIE